MGATRQATFKLLEKLDGPFKATTLIPITPLERHLTLKFIPPTYPLLPQHPALTYFFSRRRTAVLGQK